MATSALRSEKAFGLRALEDASYRATQDVRRTAQASNILVPLAISRLEFQVAQAGLLSFDIAEHSQRIEAGARQQAAMLDDTVALLQEGKLSVTNLADQVEALQEVEDAQMEQNTLLAYGLHEVVRKVEANEMRSHMTSFGVQEVLNRDSAGTMAVAGKQDRMLKEQQKTIEEL
jgi:hypothetical protein